MIGTYFSHETIKNATAVFGSLFNNIIIQRNDGKYIGVPISYGPRQKWLEAANTGFNADIEMLEKLLPRMSYEMVAMNYDVSRKITNKQKVIRNPDIFERPRQYSTAPVPYTVDFSLYIQTKTLNDGWQILEQILPFFTPSYVVKVRHFPADANIETPHPVNAYDMPFTLTAVTWTDDWTGEIASVRTIEWQLEFSTKLWLYGPVASSSIILDSRAIISTPEAGKTLQGLSRYSDLEGTEVGHVNLDSDTIVPIYENDSDLSPNIINLFDSDGNIVKIIRDVNTIF